MLVLITCSTLTARQMTHDTGTERKFLAFLLSSLPIKVTDTNEDCAERESERKVQIKMASASSLHVNKLTAFRLNSSALLTH